MSVVAEGGNKPVYTDFFIIFLIRIEGAKTLKIKNFLRVMLRLAYHNFEFLLSSVILGKVELLFPTPVLLLPEVDSCPIKGIGFSYKYFWIQVSLQLVTHLEAESFSTRKLLRNLENYSF